MDDFTDSGFISLDSSRTDLPLFKIVLLGDFGVGKSTFFVRYKQGEYIEKFSEYGLDKHDKIYKRDENSYVLQIWDTVGLERTMSMTENYFRFSHAVMIFYDVDDKSTANSAAHRWKENAERYCKKDMIYFVVGTKTDIIGSNKITLDYMRSEMTDIPKNHFFEISSKTGKGFENCLNEIVDILLKFKNPIKKRNSFTEYDDTEEKKDDNKNKWKICSC